MPPCAAQAPKAMSTCDLRRSRRAIASWSVVRMAPLRKVATMPPSGIASTSFSLKSSATGQKTMSTAAATSSTFSARSTTASSQPPQAPHQ